MVTTPAQLLLAIAQHDQFDAEIALAQGALRNLDVGRVRAFVLHQDPTNPSMMLLGTNMGIFKSIDRGASWTFMTPPPAPRVANAGTTASR